MCCQLLSQLDLNQFPPVSQLSRSSLSSITSTLWFSLHHLPHVAIKDKPTALTAKDPPSQIFKLQGQSAANTQRRTQKDRKDVGLTLGFSQLHLGHFPSWNQHPVLTTTPPWAFPVDLHGHFLHLCTVLTSTWTRSQKFHSVSTGSEKSHFFTPCHFLTNGGYSLGSRQGMHQPGKSRGKR